MTQIMQQKNRGGIDLGSTVVGYFLSCLFTVELGVRILAAGKSFLVNHEDKAWNWFDTILVLFGWIEILVHSSQDSRASSDDDSSKSGASSTGRALRILRIVRIVRTLRIGRIMRYARTFKQIAYAMQASIS